MNTLVFGHPVQNSSSHMFKELFGVKQPKEAMETITFGDAGRPRTLDFGQGSVHKSQSSEDESVCSHSHKSGSQIQYTQWLGRGDPGDSDGDDSDNGRGATTLIRDPRNRYYQVIHDRTHPIFLWTLQSPIGNRLLVM